MLGKHVAATNFPTPEKKQWKNGLWGRLHRKPLLRIREGAKLNLETEINFPSDIVVPISFLICFFFIFVRVLNTAEIPKPSSVLTSCSGNPTQFLLNFIYEVPIGKNNVMMRVVFSLVHLINVKSSMWTTLYTLRKRALVQRAWYPIRTVKDHVWAHSVQL